MSWNDFAQWLFYGLLSGISIYAVRVLSNLDQSVQDLNVSMGILLTKTSGHEKELERIDRRLLRLEKVE